MRQHSKRGSQTASLKGRVIRVSGINPKHIKARVLTTDSVPEEEDTVVEEVQKEDTEGEAE